MAADMFLKLGKIAGESEDSKHKGEIELLSFSWGLSNAGSMAHGGGGGTGKPTFNELSITKHMDKASTTLQLTCATGEHVADGTLTCRKSGKGQQEFLIYKLYDVIVTRVDNSVSDTGEGLHISESVALQFAKVEVEYKAQKADGSLDASVFFKYNVKKNEKY